MFPTLLPAVLALILSGTASAHSDSINKFERTVADRYHQVVDSFEQAAHSVPAATPVLDSDSYQQLPAVTADGQPIFLC